MGVQTDKDIVCAVTKVTGVHKHQYGLANRELAVINSGTGNGRLEELLVTTNLTTVYIYLLFTRKEVQRMYKGFKIRIYPTKKQEELFWKHIHACRYIWNYMLDLQEKRYNANEKHLSTFSMVNLITGLKRDGEHDWLKEVSRHSLDRVCKDLDHAYQ